MRCYRRKARSRESQCLKLKEGIRLKTVLSKTTVVRVGVASKTGEVHSKAREVHSKARERDPAKEEEGVEEEEAFEKAAGVARGSLKGEAAVTRG